MNIYKCFMYNGSSNFHSTVSVKHSVFCSYFTHEDMETERLNNLSKVPQ